MDWNSILTICSFGGFIITILSFTFTRGDKSNKDTADRNYRQGILDQQLKAITEKLEKIERKLDTYDNEIDTKIDKAISNHIKEFHKKGVKNE